jgi:hypothetical protein
MPYVPSADEEIVMMRFGLRDWFGAGCSSQAAGNRTACPQHRALLTVESRERYVVMDERSDGKLYLLSLALVVMSALLALSLGPVQAQIVTGAGTPGHMPLWLDYTTIGESAITQHFPGLIGIGTENPVGSLHVSSSLGYTIPQIRITQDAPLDFARLRFDSFAPDFEAYPYWDVAAGLGMLNIYNTSSGNVMSFQSANGAVGIGTTDPVGNLHIVSGSGYTLPQVRITQTTPFDYARLRFDSFGSASEGYPYWDVAAGDGVLNVYDSHTGNLMTFSSDGKVGVGTVEPSAKLHVNGDFVVTNGSKSALVETASYGKRLLYAVESPGNWFEDFGSATMVRGRAVVKLDPVFCETVNTAEPYHVFLTAKGDCEGLYVTHQTAGSFEVAELRKGDHTVTFDYRIIAKRKGFEDVRLAEVKDRQIAQASEGRLRQELALQMEKDVSAVPARFALPARNEGAGLTYLRFGTLPLLSLGFLGFVGYAWRWRKRLA